MKKYLAVTRITLANILQYRWEFILTQARTLLLLLTLYFLWSAVYSRRPSLFGFDYQEIITYIFLAAILRQFIMLSPADQIAAELQSGGKFFAYLLRPIGYFRYWLTVDLVHKIINLASITVIASLLLNFLGLVFITPATLLSFSLFALAVFLAALIYFHLAVLVSITGFWTSEVWGLQFLMILVLEFSAGVYFPINILPETLRTVILWTPFPLLMYHPISIFLGKLSLVESVRVISLATLWLVLANLLLRIVWQRGLKTYEAWGG